MSPHEFIAKWKPAELKERAACQEHFLDLCRLLGHQTPAEADPKGEWFTFEKGVVKDVGGQGFADVWKREHFGWEYKGKRKNLDDAYRQLAQYREALENPPLLVVCDLNRFEVHTNFTGTVKKVHAFDLDGLADPKNLAVLRNAFTNPPALDPRETQDELTATVAKHLTALADGFRTRAIDPHRAAHFIMKCVFCMFAEDVDLLPHHLFLKMLKKHKHDRKNLAKAMKQLFEAMSRKDGQYGDDPIAWFNGNLFDDADVLEIYPEEVRYLEDAAAQDWASVNPSIFGTLFERLLDPGKRSQTGAHYTSREDIETLLKPVLLAPLRREWDAIRTKMDTLHAEAVKKKKKKVPAKFQTLGEGFLHRLRDVTVLDPACGSGNFLYVALRMLLDLEKEVLVFLAARDQQNRLQSVSPKQLHGIEINPYAAELAQIVIWIGLLQWQKENGYSRKEEPILESMRNIENRDAILDVSDPANPKEPDWPDAEFIVGNPPFLGGKLLRRNLGDAYVDAMFKVWGKRVRPEADLCVYWFEKARAKIESAGRAGLRERPENTEPDANANRGAGLRERPEKDEPKLRALTQPGSSESNLPSVRAGLLATQGIRGGANRDTLTEIKRTGDIFFAVSDRNWVLDGAMVHISMVGFDGGLDKARILDGSTVETIHANLSATSNIATALPIQANLGIGFMGDTKGGPFDIDEATALQLLHAPNINGRPSSDVVVPWRAARPRPRC